MSVASVEPTANRSEVGRKVFLSYSSADSDRAARIAQTLDQAGIEVVRVDQMLSAGDEIFSAVARAIDESDAVVFLLSENSASSSGLGAELAYAMAGRLHGDSTRVVPVILDKGIELPILLRDLYFLDLSDPATFDERVQELARLLRSEAPVPTSVSEERRKAEAIQLRLRTLQLEMAEYERQRAFRREHVAALAQSLTVGIAVAAALTASIVTSFLTKGGGAVGVLVSVTSILAALTGVYVGRFWLSDSKRRRNGRN